jgi:hypothetical protein
MPRYVAMTLALLTLSLASTAAALEVTVSAGDYDRTNTPVSVPITLPQGQTDYTAAELTSDGQTLLGQITSPSLVNDSQSRDTQSKELWFIMPGLKAKQEKTYQVKLLKQAPDSAETFHWTSQGDKYDELSLGQRPVLRYMREPLDTSSKERIGETYKVYHHVYDPQGKQFVTKGPGGLFPHHRGLFYGFNRISYGDGKKADVWHCRNGESQSHEQTVSTETGVVLGRHKVEIAWRGQDGQPFAIETRQMTAYNTPQGVMIDFASRLESKVGEVKLDGDPQHAGFQFRASQQVPDETADQTYYLRPDGRGQAGKFRNWPGDKEHVDLAWNALSFVLGEQRYTTAYLDRPENPKEARFSERNYGRFGSYFATTIDEDQPLRLKYRIVLREGELDVEQANSLSHDFVQPPKVQVN